MNSNVSLLKGLTIDWETQKNALNDRKTEYCVRWTIIKYNDQKGQKYFLDRVREEEVLCQGLVISPNQIVSSRVRMVLHPGWFCNFLLSLYEEQN